MRYTIDANMWYFIAIILNALTLAASKHITVTNDSTRGKMMVCTTSTAADLKESKFKIENSDLNLCTHLICIDNIWDKTIDPWRPKENQKEDHYKRFTGLRVQHPNLKVSLAMKYSLADYARNAATQERRQRFIKRTTEFITGHKFNGVDLMWDFSDQSELHTVDKENILNLLKELKKTFEHRNLMVTSTFIAENKKFTQEIDVNTWSKYLDFLHFMPKYNYVETWPGSHRVQDVIKAHSLDNLKDSIDGLISLGVPAEKIVIGIQFIGLSFHSILDLPPTYASFRRSMSFNDVCRLLTTTTDQKTKWEKFYDDEFGITIAKDEPKSWRGILNNIPFIRPRDVIVYESGRSIANKIKFALSRKLAGAMAFPIDMDDYRGNCGLDEDAFADYNLGGTPYIPNHHNITQPLLKTISFAFSIALFEEPEARQPNKDAAATSTADGGIAANGSGAAVVAATSETSDRISNFQPVDDITSKVPEKYKPLIPLIHSANDAMVVGYDKLREKANIYKKDKPILTMILFNIPEVLMFFGITLMKLFFG